MQKAIVLHPNQNVILIKEQKKIIHSVNSKGGLLFPVYPLWIFLKGAEFEERSPKEISLLIRSLAIGNALLSDETLIFPVKIVMSDNTPREEKIVAATAKNIPPSCRTSATKSGFSMDCKIFRIAEATQDDCTHSYELWNFVWHKTKS